ncbi:unnamed protein product, partial [Adineta ricciae]
TEQECHAIIYAIEKWHKYLDGRPFTIETDHKPLLPFNQKRQLNAKCERWRLKLQQYNFTIQYIKGKHNTVADYLSRTPHEDAAIDEDDYAPVKSQSTQTEELTRTLMIAPVLTRAQVQQQQRHHGRIDRTSDDQACSDVLTERNGDSPIERSRIQQ